LTTRRAKRIKKRKRNRGRENNEFVETFIIFINSFLSYFRKRNKNREYYLQRGIALIFDNNKVC